MKTITFYSYKGGVGRTLLLANVARYLARFGQKVVVVDFDLEAPGLHYKFGLWIGRSEGSSFNGLVDYIHELTALGRRPTTLDDFVYHLPSEECEGSILMMPAGNVTLHSYWQRLARIDWNDLFYREGALGIPLFLDLKARIEKEYAPDYLLIDSRTGITEVGGVATTVLPDCVVALLLTNKESVEGTRTVLRSIHKTLRIRGLPPMEILPVIARLPDTQDQGEALRRVEDYLNEPATELADTLKVSEPAVLHVDRAIERQEAVLIGSSGTQPESPLLRDYLRLVSRLVSADVIQPYIEPLVEEALKRAWHDPTGAEGDLNELAQYSTHPAPHRALLMLYRLRNETDNKLFWAIRRYWHLTNNAADPLLFELVSAYFDPDQVEMDQELAEVADAVWRANNKTAIELGLRVASAYREVGANAEATRTVLEVLGTGTLTAQHTIRCLSEFWLLDNYEEAFRLVDAVRSQFREYPEFVRLWARLVSEVGDPDRAYELFHSASLDFTNASLQDLVSFVNVHRLAGDSDEALQETLKQVPLRGKVRRTDRPGVLRLWSLYDELGLSDEFEVKIKRELPQLEADGILRQLATDRTATPATRAPRRGALSP